MTFDTLASVGQARGSGELVVAGSNLEAHVYLLQGRLAWATSTLTTSPFLRHLRDRGIEKDVLAEVIRECRHRKRRLEDTLIDWGVASPEQVRDAQIVQICESLATLVDAGELDTLFLSKHVEYDADRTYSLAEIAAACTGPLAPVRSAIEDAFERLPEPAPTRPAATLTDEDRRSRMANAKESLPRLMEIDGCLGACIVDSTSGMMLGAAGGGVDLELAAAGNTEVVRAKRKTMNSLELNEQIEDILITLGKQYHVIRPVSSNEALFIYLVLDKNRANLAMARHQLRSVETDLVI